MNNRNFIRHKKFLKEKKLLALYKRYDELRNTEFNVIEEIILDKPIKVGYCRTFVLSEIAKQLKEAPFIEEALKACNIVQFSRTRLFNDDIFIPRYISGVSYSYLRKSDLREINEDEYNKLSDKAKHYFVNKEYDINSFRIYNKYAPKYIKSTWIKFKVSPHYIYSISKYDSSVISEKNRIYNYLKTHDYFNKIYKLQDGSVGDNYRKYEKKYKRRVERKNFNQNINKLTR